MKSFFKKIWDGWMKFAYALGDFISAIFLVAFYFTVFALVAIPYRIAKRPFHASKDNKDSNWTKGRELKALLEDFQKEY